MAHRCFRLGWPLGASLFPPPPPQKKERGENTDVPICTQKSVVLRVQAHMYACMRAGDDTGVQQGLYIEGERKEAEEG
jgi:hypothetical protein